MNKAARQGARYSKLWDTLRQGTGELWQLQDAKAQFSDVVQRAIDGHPQCVTKHGKKVVIVISYDSLLEEVRPKENLYDFFRSSPLAGSNLNIERLPGGLREVEL